MGETIVTTGANHGGTVALNTMLGQLPGKRVTAFDRNSNISFLGCGIALWIDGQISGPEGLSYSSKEAFEEKGTIIHTKTEVTRVDFDGKVVYTRGKSGEDFVQECDRLILTTGPVPLHPEIEGMELDSVQFVKLYQNAKNVIRKLKDTSAKKVAVMGAGYMGVELTEAFERSGREVALVDLADTRLSRYYSRGFSDRMAHNLQEHSVKPAFSEKAVRLGGGRRVERVVTDQECYEADMVVFGIGFEPNTAFGQGRLRTFGNGASPTDRKRETSVPGVYAVGDCVTVYNNAIQAADYVALATNVVRSGIIAVHNTCGKVLESVGVQGSNGISIRGFHMLGAGIDLTRVERVGCDTAVTSYEGWQKAEFTKNRNHKVKIRTIYDRKFRIVLGTQMCPNYDVSMDIHMSSVAVEEQAAIDRPKLSDLFFLPHSDGPYNYVTMAVLGAEQDRYRKLDETGNRNGAGKQGGLEPISIFLLFIPLRGEVGKCIIREGGLSLWKQLRERI